MLESLKHAGLNVRQELGRAWENISDGWHELLRRGGGSLTHFSHQKSEGEEPSSELSTLPRWSLLAGEVEETTDDVIVRVELPGIAREDCQITIDGNMLYLSGEKHFERDRDDSAYHVMERAYGVFQRAISLPRNVNPDKALASYKNGVLTVRLPKQSNNPSRNIPIS